MTAPVASTVSKPPSVIHVDWNGEYLFDAGRPGGPTMHIDASGKTGQSPVDTLLSALATCSASDVVDILAKRRTPIESMQIDVVGERVDSVPRRFKHITLTFHITGAGIDRDHAERAIDLSVNKYCSVRDSLSRDIVVDWKLDLNTKSGS